MVSFDLFFAGDHGSYDSTPVRNANIAGLGGAFGDFPRLWANNFPDDSNFETSASVCDRGVGWTGAICREFWSSFGTLAVIARGRILGSDHPRRIRIDYGGRLPGVA